MKIKKHLLIALMGGVFLSACNSEPKTANDRFASCLKERGAVFYGTYWCPHCQEQKKIFGSSAQFLPYVECASGNGQTKECQEKEIKGYPTWIFADGSRQEGQMSLEELGQKANCPLPSQQKL